MKFEDLRHKMAGRPYFRPEDLRAGGTPAAYEIVQLSNWAQEGKVVRLKKGLYTLAQEHRRIPVSALELAEPLCRPSYVSLEWALSRYGLIPEAVGTITSVTSLKTAHYRNGFGDFDYRHAAQAYFFGFTREKSPVPHYLAIPEKALLDFIHLSIPKSTALTADLFLDGYRLQNLDRLKKKKLAEALLRFTTPRVALGGKILMNLLRKTHA